MSPSPDRKSTDRGYIIPIGGAEEKLQNPEILDRFVELCGGKPGRIAIIPTASQLEDTGRNSVIPWISPNTMLSDHCIEQLK